MMRNRGNKSSEGKFVAYYEQIYSLIIQEDRQERDGDSPILRCARTVRTYDPVGEDAAIHRDVANAIVNRWKTLTPIATGNAADFFILAGLPLPDLRKTALSVLSGLKADNYVHHRADLCRLLNSQDWAPPEDFFQDTALMTQRPGVWFDLACNSGLRRVIDCVHKLTKVAEAESIIVSRTPSIASKFSRTEITRLIESLEVNRFFEAAEELRIESDIISPAGVPFFKGNSPECFTEAINDLADHLSQVEPMNAYAEAAAA